MWNKEAQILRCRLSTVPPLKQMSTLVPPFNKSDLAINLPADS